MKKVFLALIFLSVIMASGFYGQPAQANLLVNGSFEDPTGFEPVDNGQNNFMSLPEGSTTLTGWQVIDAEIAWLGANYGLTAFHGDYWLDLTGFHDSLPFGGVQQTINTVFGQSYVLEFDLGNLIAYGPSAAITVSAGSTSQDFFNTSITDSWKHFAMPFTAGPGSTLISLMGIEVAGQNCRYIALDNVTVTVVPLPPTALLLGASLLRLARYARRRQT
ncbi:MAG: DUF642 domain-containing protein [Thermodesulfobacteriota bacterium]